MENVTQGHWIFGAVSAIVFLGLLAWAYMKDRSSHRLHYKGGTFFVLGLITLTLVLFWVRKFI